MTAANLDDLRRQALDEIPVVRDEDERAAIVGERVQQDFLGIDVEVVGRFVEQQGVRRTQQHARDGQPRAFAAAQHPGLLVNVVAGKQEAAEDVADRRHHVMRRSVRQRVMHSERGIEPRRFVLREILHHHLVAFVARAGVR